MSCCSTFWISCFSVLVPGSLFGFSGWRSVQLRSLVEVFRPDGHGLGGFVDVVGIQYPASCVLLAFTLCELVLFVGHF